MIELFLENQKIDLADDLEINFTYETIDPNKLSAIKNSFSKTINIQGTPANNKTFGHIWRFDKIIQDGESNINNYYDPHKKVNWFINKNGVLINRGYCTLDTITITNERDINYQLTLYGGIGEFFYSLSFNEDGTPKTLYDIYFNWKPKTSLIGYGNQLNPSDEQVDNLMTCSADIVAQSYHNLNPFNNYSGTTDIDKDICFIPCYTGQYENFDSSHQIVSTFNQNFYSGAIENISDETRAKLQESFPDVYTETVEENGSAITKTYTTIGKTLSSSDTYKYGLVGFSRNLDPTEAGDFRVNELPVALRVAKLMTVLSQPENNGGYNVVWDDEIKNSYYWLYSWVLLGKIKQELDTINTLSIEENETYNNYVNSFFFDSSVNDINPIALHITPQYNLTLSTTSLKAGTYNLIYNYLPYIQFNYDNYYIITPFRFWVMQEQYELISGNYYNYQISGQKMGYQIWNTLVKVKRVYDDNNLIKSIADVYYFYSRTSSFGHFNYCPRGDINTYAQDYLKNKINSKLSIALDDIIIHNCLIKKTNNTAKSGSHTSGWTEPYYSYYEVTANLDNEKTTINLTLDNDTNNLNIVENTLLMWTYCEYTDSNVYTSSGVYGEDNPISPYIGINISNRGSFFSFAYNNNNCSWCNPIYEVNDNEFRWFSTYKFTLPLNTARQNGFLENNSSGFNILKLDKKTLFANSNTPMKYLTDFCKLLNLKFICNNTSKTIYIKTLKNYYVDSAININDKVDFGQEITIKPVITNYKKINIGLDTPETYPISIFNKNSKDKFNTYKFETGIEFNTTETDLLKDSIYKNTMDWQLNSVYYKIVPQFPRAYDTPTINWTLFDTSNQNINQMGKKELFTNGIMTDLNNLVSGVDFYPKQGLFDKNNKIVEAAFPSLVFLNGFVKNYDYKLCATVESGDTTVNYYSIAPRIIFSNDTIEQYYLNGERCYMYDFKYNDSFPSWGYYSSQQKGSATSWTLPFFSKDLYNLYVQDVQEWENTPYKVASWNITNQDGLDNVINYFSTTFVNNSGFEFDKLTNDLSQANSNEYTLNSIPIDNEGETRIFETQFKDYINDLFDKNSREITLWVDLSRFNDPNEIMRQTYIFKGNKWIITKIYNYKTANIVNDRFTKITLHKIMDINNWTNS